MVQEVLAGIVLAVCAALLLRMLIGERLRSRIDRDARGLWRACKRMAHWRSSRREAARTAEEAIRRARRRGEWEGNVYRPNSFRREDEQD